MLIIPAIDIKDGHCVRLKQGDMADATVFSEDPGAMDALAQVAKLDMRRWWTATARSYFGCVPKSQILAAITEAASASSAASVEKLKKGALAEEAERRLAEKGWLPSLMRTPA